MNLKKYHFSNIESDDEKYDSDGNDSDGCMNLNFSDIDSDGEFENKCNIEKTINVSQSIQTMTVNKPIFTFKELFLSLILLDFKNKKYN